MSELSPCPFCGGEMKTTVITFEEEFYEPPYESWYLEHIDLNAAADERCPIPTTDTFYETETEAIEAWNNRAGCKNCAALNKAAGLWAKADKRARDLERTCHPVIAITDDGGYEYALCSECDGRIEPEDNYCPNCGAKVVSE